MAEDTTQTHRERSLAHVAGPAPRAAAGTGKRVVRRRRARHARVSAAWIALGVVFLIIGLTLLTLPLVLQLRNQMEENARVDTYASQVRQAAQSQPSVVEEERAAADAYNAGLAAGRGAILPIGSEESNSDATYMGLLSGFGPMGTVSIPKISVNLPIYHGTTESVLTTGAGHLYGTSLPTGGPSTHSVLAAHRGMPNALMFTRLDELEVGDTFTISVLGEDHVYRVDQIKVVDPDKTSGLFPIVEGEDYVSLLTCTPYGINTQRLVVRGRRVVQEQAAQVAADVAPELGIYPAGYTLILIAVVVAAAFTLIAVFHRLERMPHGRHIAQW